MVTILSIAGGVALVLFGVRFLNKGLDRLLGRRLGVWMQRLASSKPRSFITGLILSIIAPSSTTHSVLAVQSVRSGYFTPTQALALVLGTNVGLTVAVQLIALDLQQYAPILILIGVVLFQFTKGTTPRGIGQVILSVGFIYLAMKIIKDGAAGTGQNQDLLDLFELAGRYPLAIAVIAGMVTVGLQSSKATLGLVIGLAAAGALTLNVAVACVLGVNVGLAVTAMIVGWSHNEARRLAMANLMLKVVISWAGLMAMGPIVRLVGDTPGSISLQIANAHSAYNVLLAMIGLPLIVPLTALASRLVPTTAEEAEPGEFGPRFIDKVPVEATALAMGQSMREILHVSEIVRGMFDDLWRALETGDAELARAVAERDDHVDLLDREIKRFVVRVFEREGDEQFAGEQMLQLRYLNELENIGDIIDKNISPLVLKKIQLAADFSGEGWKDLDDFCQKVRENLLIADTVFMQRDETLAVRLTRHKHRLNAYEAELRDRHFARLRAGLGQSQETTAIHLDLLTHMKRINSCAAYIGYEVLRHKGREDAES